MNLDKVSVIITSFNEAGNIERCFAPLREFGEIVVVDSFSSDGTLDVARRYGATVYQRPYPSAAKQKNWALERVRHPWVLILDADEAVTDELLDELRQLDEAQAADGYWIRRESEYLGRPIRHCGWQRDKVLRFFKTGCGRYGEVEVHEEVEMSGQVEILDNMLLHFPYRRVERHIGKIQEYSSRGARDYVERGGRHALAKMLLHPPLRFMRMYVAQGGFMDGREGFLLCLLASYSVFLKYAKAWELLNCRADS